MHIPLAFLALGLVIAACVVPLAPARVGCLVGALVSAGLAFAVSAFEVLGAKL